MSARSNPTDLVEIERGRVKISVSDVSGERGFTLDRLDLREKRIPGHMSVVVVARAGNTSARITMGTVDRIDNRRQPLSDIDPSHPLRFRVLVHPEDDPKLVASIENIRPYDDASGESLLPMVPADLGERLWRVVIDEAGPELHFNASIFPNAAGAENYVPFTTLVLPEALHQVMRHIADDPELLEDEQDAWFGWAAWLTSIGADLQPESDDDESKEKWCNDVVSRFCVRAAMAARLGKELSEGGHSD
jgi:hypothetical protein